MTRMKQDDTFDLHGGEPFWIVNSGLGYVVPKLEENITCDVVILGGGITGALIADALSEHDLDIVLLDRRHLGRGSTAASTALLQYDIDTPLFKLRDLVPPDHADRAYKLGIEAIDELEEITKGVDCQFSRHPSLFFGVGSDAINDLKQEYDARKSIGLDVAWLEHQELERDYGILANGAIHSTVAAQVNPFELTHHLLKNCSQSGVRIFDKTNVESIDDDASPVTIVVEGGKVVKANWVVHATGYESVQTLPRDVVDLQSTFAFISEPIEMPNDKWTDRALVWEYADPYCYVRWHDDRMIVGGEDEPFKNEKARDALIASKIDTLVDKLGRRFPQLPLDPAFKWAGTFGSTKDGLGYIGAIPEKPHALYALGFGGNGITYSTIARRLITNLIMNTPSKENAIFSFDR